MLGGAEDTDMSPACGAGSRRSAEHRDRQGTLPLAGQQGSGALPSRALSQCLPSWDHSAEPCVGAPTPTAGTAPLLPFT